MTQRTYFMLCWSFQLSLVCMLRNVRDDSMRGLGSEHLLRVHDSHFQLGCCSPTRACLLLCSPRELLEHISLFFTNTIYVHVVDVSKTCILLWYCHAVSRPTPGGWWLYTEWRVAWIMDAGSSQYRSVVICKQFSFRMCNYHVSSRSSSFIPTSSSDLSADSDLCTKITGHRC